MNNVDLLHPPGYLVILQDPNQSSVSVSPSRHYAQLAVSESEARTFSLMARMIPEKVLATSVKLAIPPPTSRALGLPSG